MLSVPESDVHFPPQKVFTFCPISKAWGGLRQPEARAWYNS